MNDDRFLVEFDRGAGSGGSKLTGELVLYVPKKGKKARPRADFRFIEVQGPTYTFYLDDGNPVLQKYVGKLRIAEHEREDLPMRLDLFKKETKCHICKGPAFKRPKGKPVPKQIQVKGHYVWCCGGCRQPELVK